MKLLVAERPREAGAELHREGAAVVYPRTRNEGVQADQHLFGLNAAVLAPGANPVVAEALKTCDIAVLIDRHCRRQGIEQALHVLGRLQQRIAIAAPDSGTVVAGAEFLDQLLALQELRAGANGPQGLQLGLDVAQLAWIADGKEIARFPEVAFDAQPGDLLAHFIGGGAADRRIHLITGEPGAAQQLAGDGMFVGHHKPGITRRCPLRSPLAVDDHNACLGVHVRQGVRRTEAGNAGADHQPVGVLRAFERVAQRRTPRLRNPATDIFHASPQVLVLRTVSISALCKIRIIGFRERCP
ncbi:hypothetical protein D3C84_759180 [compost metagenome]